MFKVSIQAKSLSMWHFLPVLPALNFAEGNLLKENASKIGDHMKSIIIRI